MPSADSPKFDHPYAQRLLAKYKSMEKEASTVEYWNWLWVVYGHIQNYRHWPESQPINRALYEAENLFRNNHMRPPEIQRNDTRAIYDEIRKLCGLLPYPAEERSNYEVAQGASNAHDQGRDPGPGAS